jgi:hypothetical protein
MILNRLLPLINQVEDAISESQCGFVPGRSTMNASFIDRGLSSEYRSRGHELYKCHIDLTKAYDRVDRKLLWKLLERLGVPPKMLASIKGLHDGARGRVRMDGMLSEWFDLSIGLRQGAVFSPTLFNIFFGEIIRQMKVKFKAENLVGARILFRRKGVGVSGKKFKDGDSNVESAVIYEALFADDLELFAASGYELQRMINIFDEIVRQFGQEISVAKTKVMIVKLKNGENGHADQPREYFVGNAVIEVLDSFKYL